MGRRQTQHWIDMGLPADRVSYIVGRSVHNTRIESMWNHLGHTVSGTYRQLFNDMENVDRVLDPYDPAHLFALHSVFVRRLQGEPPRSAGLKFALQP